MSSDIDGGETLPSPPGQRSPGAPLLSPQQLLASRFRIIRFLARGGMGEVYEAEDLELQERVALKTVRSEIAHDSKAMARFKHEIQLARKVTHPNVCRTFDVFHHRTPSSPGLQEDVTFLSMELLPGETLEKRLRRVGRMTAAEAFPLVNQMAAALAAAHTAGIVHRDFKSANVVLVPSRQEEGIRVVVTDFGLAPGNASEDGSQSLMTMTGGLSGTPIYMAPEQIEGRGITRAVDIYGLGVVMYEMVTRTFPFTGETPFEVAFKRLREAPCSPRMHVPDLDRKWEKTILRCLERDPADRFEKPTEVVAALREEVSAGDLGSRTKNPRLALAVIALVGFLAIGVTYLSSLVEIPPRRRRHPSEVYLPWRLNLDAASP